MSTWTSRARWPIDSVIGRTIAALRRELYIGATHTL